LHAIFLVDAMAEISAGMVFLKKMHAGFFMHEHVTSRYARSDFASFVLCFSMLFQHGYTFSAIHHGSA